MAVVSKPLDPLKAKGYQLKDNFHTFHLIPSGTLCDHWSGRRDALKTGPILYKNFFLQRVDGFPYVEASMVQFTFERRVLQGNQTQIHLIYCKPMCVQIICEFT